MLLTRELYVFNVKESSLRTLSRFQIWWDIIIAVIGHYSTFDAKQTWRPGVPCVTWLLCGSRAQFPFPRSPRAPRFRARYTITAGKRATPRSLFCVGYEKPPMKVEQNRKRSRISHIETRAISIKASDLYKDAELVHAFHFWYKFLSTLSLQEYSAAGNLLAYGLGRMSDVSSRTGSPMSVEKVRTALHQELLVLDIVQDEDNKRYTGKPCRESVSQNKHYNNNNNNINNINIDIDNNNNNNNNHILESYSSKCSFLVLCVIDRTCFPFPSVWKSPVPVIRPAGYNSTIFLT